MDGWMTKERKGKCNEIRVEQERLAANDTRKREAGGSWKRKSDIFENEAVKRGKGWEKESEEAEEKKIEKGCILFILHSSDLEGVQGPELCVYIGTSPCALSSWWIFIYLYIFLDLFCSDGVLFGLALLRLDHLVVLRSVLKDRTESRTTARSKNRSRNISLIHNSCG